MPVDQCEVFAPWARWQRGWVVEDARVRGFATVEHEPWHERLILWFLYIEPAYRRRGVARALLEQVEAFGRELGASHVWLETSNVNVPGVRAYERLGFEMATTWGGFCIADKLYLRYVLPMKLSDGVEQAIHCVVMLASLPEDGLLSAASLAEFHGVSQSYLLKHLQPLSLAGILESVPGPRGGYRLAPSPDKVSLLDIVLTVEGNEPAFRCTEIRQRGPGCSRKKPTRPCEINAAMLRAEQAYRAELARVTIASVIAKVAKYDEDGAIARRGSEFITLRVRHARRDQ